MRAARRDCSEPFDRPGFSELFNRALAACAESQQIIAVSARTAGLARASRAQAQRLRRAVAQLRESWADAEATNSIFRHEVERVAREMRQTEIDDRAAVATVRAHIRFVLYDGGLTEQATEPVVQRASLWVEKVYAAA